MHDSNFNKGLDEYTCEMSRLFKAEGWRYAGNLFSVGWPDVGKAHQFKASMTELAKNGHLWGPHEYNNPVCQVMGSDGKPYWMGRIAMTIKELRQANASIPTIYIGECGVDCGVSTPEANNPPGKGVVATKGWQYLSTDHQAYFDQLIWYDDVLAQAELQLHVPILTACIYNSGSYSPWETFEVNDPLLDLLINRWQTYRGQRTEPGQPPVEEHVSKPPPEPVEDPASKAIEHINAAMAECQAAIDILEGR